MFQQKDQLLSENLTARSGIPSPDFLVRTVLQGVITIQTFFFTIALC